MGSQGLGQVLDLETGANETLGPELTEEAILQRFPKLRAPETPEDTAPRSDPGAEMDVEKTFDGNMAAQMVLAAVALQEERVAVYKDYDAAFKYLLQAEGQKATRALAWLYPFVVRCATVRFQAVSQGVRSVARDLETRSETSRKPLATQVDEASQSLRALQRMEAERLQLVAAHHADQGRQLLSQEGLEEASAKTISEVKKRLGRLSQDIDELVSELRYTAADMRP